MRALGVDVGERRIGVALSDELGLLAAPLTTVTVRGSDAALAELATIARERAAEVVVVGLPKSLSGREGPQAQAVRAFADRLAPLIDVPIEFWDERLTTVEAERALIARGVKRQQRRARIDAAAAAIMLQDYLDAHRARRVR
ncbi:MAG TPA: Holliday junction resolvase RuvX [Thermomicrobiales bacterium]|nr:Holliday junction resolvase RuvX [Thermomicrobiales bacterium]